MDKNKNAVITERYCPVINANVVIMRDLSKNGEGYRCISYTGCINKKECRVFLQGQQHDTSDAS